MVRQCHREGLLARLASYPSYLLAEEPSGQVLGQPSWYSQGWTLCAPNALKCIQGHAYFHAVQTGPVTLWSLCLAHLPLQTYPMTFIRCTRTPGVRQKCLLPQVQMGFVGYLSSSQLQVEAWVWTWDALLPEDHCSRPCGSPCCRGRVLTAPLPPLHLR